MVRQVYLGELQEVRIGALLLQPPVGELKLISIQKEKKG